MFLLSHFSLQDPRADTEYKHIPWADFNQSLIVLEVRERKRMRVRGDGAGLVVQGKERLQAGDPNVRQVT